MSFISANFKRKIKTLGAEIEWQLQGIEADRKNQSSYQVWAKRRRHLFTRWGNLPTSRAENRRLEKLKNKYSGQRIFLIGNGPSLNNMDLSKLNDEYTFGVNRIYLLFDKITWRPTFYTVNDWEVGPDNAEEINALENMTLFFPKRFQGLFEDTQDVYWYNSRHGHHTQDYFSYDLADGAVMGGSVLHLVIQIAFYMGFDPIYLIGVDANYKILDTVQQSGRTFADGNLQFLKSTEDDDPNHFDARYFGKNRRWHNPNVMQMIEGFSRCREAIEAKGGHIYNATLGGKLEVMERTIFEDIFNSEFTPKPTISIIMPAYNAAAYIDQAIDSVVNQSYRNWELLVVNDGSADQTAEVVARYKDRRVRLISQDNKGRSQARNTALAVARGDYIAFLDADDYYSPEKLERQLQFLQCHPQADVAVGGYNRIGAKHNVLTTVLSAEDELIPVQSLFYGNPVLLQGAMYRREALGKLRFNPEAKAGEDWEFNLQAALLGCQFVSQPEIVCVYRATDQAYHKTTETYAEHMIATIQAVFDGLPNDSPHHTLRRQSLYLVNVRMAARLLSVGNRMAGEKIMAQARSLSPFPEIADEALAEDVFQSLVNWMTNLEISSRRGMRQKVIKNLPNNISPFRLRRTLLKRQWRRYLKTLLAGQISL